MVVTEPDFVPAVLHTVSPDSFMPRTHRTRKGHVKLVKRAIRPGRRVLCVSLGCPFKPLFE